MLKNGIDLVTGGTDNHLMLVDLTKTGVTGKEAQHFLDEVNITCNKNGIPYDTRSPFVTSGIRLGTPAVTTRGMNADDMIIIADAINLAIRDFDKNSGQVREMVRMLVERYPLY